VEASKVAAMISVIYAGVAGESTSRIWECRTPVPGVPQVYGNPVGYGDERSRRCGRARIRAHLCNQPIPGTYLRNRGWGGVGVPEGLELAAGGLGRRDGAGIYC
jgi:hypothetical protein